TLVAVFLTRSVRKMQRAGLPMRLFYTPISATGKENHCPRLKLPNKPDVKLHMGGFMATIPACSKPLVGINAVIADCIKERHEYGDRLVVANSVRVEHLREGDAGRQRHESHGYFLMRQFI